MGDIGEFIVIARRYRGSWFVGAMTNAAARTVKVPLDFLGTGRFIARIHADGDTPSALVIAEGTVDRRDTIEFRVAPTGRGRHRFSPVR